MIETEFLNKVKNKEEVNVYFIGGVKWKGIVKDFDDKTILLDNNLIYKSAISAIELWRT